LIADVVTRRPDEVSLLTLGPLSTIGDFVTRHPELASAFEQIVVMGGAARGPGNALPFGEANIAHDPGAAAAVLQAAWSRPGTLVGLDVTNIATLSEAEFELVGEHRTMTAEFLDEPLSFYRRFGSAFSPPGECPNHDLLAAMVWVEPDIVTTSLLPVEVDCGGGPAWGTTVVDLRQPFFARAGADSEQGVADTTPLWNVALDVDIQRFRTNVRRMFGDPGGSHP
jgi:purine nucleosidase